MVGGFGTRGFGTRWLELGQKHRLVAVGTWLACAWLAGCGATSSNPDMPNAGASGVGGGASGAGTGGSTAGGSAAGSSTTGGSTAVSTAGNPGGGSGGSTAGAGGTMGAGGDGPRQVHTGQVAVVNRFTSGLSMTVYFIESSSGSSSATCTAQSANGCTLTVCDDGSSTAMSTYASAGTVTLSSADLPSPLSISPDANNGYMSPLGAPSGTFGGGEHFDLAASGGDVPAFQVAMDVPLVLLLSQPLFATTSPGIFVSQSQDLALTWTRGVENVSFYIQASSARADGLPGGASLICNFPSTDGAAVIPAALLSKLPLDTKLYPYTTITQQIKAGDYDVLVAYVTAIANPDKSVIPSFILAE